MNKYKISYKDMMYEDGEIIFIGSFVQLMRLGQTLRRNAYRDICVKCLEENDDELPF